MAVNKNFVVKNGLEVGTDLILANTNNSRVGIGTSLPTDTLHVNGGIAGTDFVISGIATIPTLNSTTGTITNLSATTISMGSTAIVNSARQLQNIASLDATTTATIESAIEAGPNTFANLNITGVSTFVGLATFGSGIEVQSGVSTFAGTVDINSGGQANTFKVEDLTQGRVVTVGAGGELQDYTGLTYDGYTLTATGVNVTGVTTSSGLIDANGGVNISGGSGLEVTGAATVSTTLGVTGTTTLAGINTFTSDGANILGIVTATSFSGDISNTTGVSTNFTASVGIQSGGNVVGAGITTLNFIGAGNSILVNSSNASIVDISISGGGGAGAATSVGGAAPVDPALGQLWFNNSVARTFIWYDEAKLSIGSSAYWVDASPFDMQGQFIEKTGDNMSGALGFAAGTTGSPGLFVNGSTNTGIYSPAANEFGFVTSGVERIRINATGTSIVGTTTVTGNINAIDGVFTGNVTVGGTLTKQDVTNVDSVGVITARGGSIVVIGDTNPTYQVKTGSTSRLKIIADTGNSKVLISSQEGYPLAFGAASGGGIKEALRITTEGYLKYSGTSTADETNKLGRLIMPSHDTNEEDVMYFQMQQEGTFNQLELGGGSSSYNAATHILFRTAAVDTVTGTERLRIGPEGNIAIGGQNTSALANQTHLFIGGMGNLYADTTAASGSSLSLSNNGYINSSGNWVYRTGGKASNIYYHEGTIGFRYADTGSAGGTISWGESLRLSSDGAFGLGGANYGTAGQVIKSAGSGSAVAWGDATVGISSAGTSIGNATTLNFIGAGNTFAINSGTVDISIAGGGGGGSGQFNTGLTNEFYGTCSGIGSTVFTAPSASGKKYILTSLLATNVATANTDVNVIGAFDFDGGERSYFAYNIPLPVGMAAELLKQPMVLNPSDKVLLRSTDIDRNGLDTIVEYYGTYEMQESADLVGVGLGSATMNDTSAKTLYTSTGAPSVLQSIRIANITDSGPKPLSISITHGSDVIRLVENLIVPKYASVEILDNQKRISSGAIVKVTLDEGSSMGVQLSAKKISAT